MPKSRSSSTSGADGPEVMSKEGGGRGGVKKQCDECGMSSPVACRMCKNFNVTITNLGYLFNLIIYFY